MFNLQLYADKDIYLTFSCILIYLNLNFEVPNPLYTFLELHSLRKLRTNIKILRLCVFVFLCTKLKVSSIEVILGLFQALNIKQLLLVNYF